tara:strand:- start:339 stop:557 length:219 start_codon:yes stop_codon:yes gene_type:complete
MKKLQVGSVFEFHSEYLGEVVKYEVMEVDPMHSFLSSKMGDYKCSMTEYGGPSEFFNDVDFTIMKSFKVLQY